MPIIHNIYVQFKVFGSETLLRPFSRRKEFVCNPLSDWLCHILTLQEKKCGQLSIPKEKILASKKGNPRVKKMLLTNFSYEEVLIGILSLSLFSLIIVFNTELERKKFAHLASITSSDYIKQLKYLKLTSNNFPSLLVHFTKHTVASIVFFFSVSCQLLVLKFELI